MVRPLEIRVVIVSEVEVPRAKVLRAVVDFPRAEVLGAGVSGTTVTVVLRVSVTGVALKET